MVEVKENRNHHICNMARETDGEGEASDEEVQDMVREEGENGEGESDNGAARDNYMDGGPTTEYNTLQDLSISTKIFEDGLISKADFRKAQENDVQLTEIIKKTRLVVKEVNGILCVEGRGRSSSNPTDRVRPILPTKLLQWYALSIHMDPSTYHQTAPQTLRRIKQQFYVLDDQVVRDEIGRCYICHIATPNTTTRHKFALQKIPDTPRSHVSFDICCGLPDDPSDFRYIFCAIDQFSNYTIAAAAKTRSVSEIIQFFRLAVFSYTRPCLLLLDGEGGC